MAAPIRDDPERRWAGAAAEVAGFPEPSRGRRTTALVVAGGWAALVLVLLIACVVPLPAASRVGWQLAAAAGLVLLGVIAALRGTVATQGALLRRVAPAADERRSVRRVLAGREPAAPGRRPVLEALARGERATSRLLLAGIVTYYLGYLAGVRADGTADAAVGLPLITVVFAALAVVPVRRLLTASGYLRRTPQRP